MEYYCSVCSIKSDQECNNKLCAKSQRKFKRLAKDRVWFDRFMGLANTVESGDKVEIMKSINLLFEDCKKNGYRHNKRTPDTLNEVLREKNFIEKQVILVTGKYTQTKLPFEKE
jgi:hypothetical protein